MLPPLQTVCRLLTQQQSSPLLPQPHPTNFSFSSSFCAASGAHRKQRTHAESEPENVSEATQIMQDSQG
jgi:hypothetical protein